MPATRTRSARRCCSAYWKDPHFNPKERAFYYVRVIEIPTPRWTTYDAKFFGTKPPAGRARRRSRSAPTPRRSGTRRESSRKTGGYIARGGQPGRRVRAGIDGSQGGWCHRHCADCPREVGRSLSHRHHFHGLAGHARQQLRGLVAQDRSVTFFINGMSAPGPKAKCHDVGYSAAVGVKADWV